MDTPLTQPNGLGERAARFWSDVVSEFSLRVDELLMLEQACHEIDLIERMQAEIDRAQALTVTGSQGQPVTDDLVKDIRQHRAVLQRLTNGLGLSGADGPAERSFAARRAVNARWARGNQAS